MRAVAEKPQDVVVKFDTYRNVQRHRAVLPAITRLLCAFSLDMNFSRGIGTYSLAKISEWEMKPNPARVATINFWCQALCFSH